MHAETIARDAPVVPVAVDSRTYAIDRALEPLRWLFRWGSLAMLVLMVALPFVQVVAREIFSAPIVGSDEFARYMLICTVFIALPYVVSAGASIRMEEVLSLFPARIVHAVRIVTAIVASATFGTGAIATLIAITTNLDNATPTLGLPYWLFFGAAFAGFSMATVECVVQLVKVLQRKPLYVTFPQEHEPQEELDLPDAMKH
jgi:TRAP-type C4-dicarboxylate transport system permease small subunit